jgi:hypothetical protein
MSNATQPPSGFPRSYVKALAVLLALVWAGGPGGCRHLKEAPSPYEGYSTKTVLHLPFEGEWYVIQGGRTVAENYHAAYPEVRFACDFVRVKDYSTHQGDGRANPDYYCFTAAVVAPGPGTLTVAEDGHPDCKPGQQDKAHPKGNHVIIDHGNGELSFLAHFRNGTIAVKVGDRVVAGQKLGQCGNSGNTSEPHLHYQLQNQAGECLPAQFTNYLADGVTINAGEPFRGQRVRASAE